MAGPGSDYGGDPGGDWGLANQQGGDASSFHFDHDHANLTPTSSRHNGAHGGGQPGRPPASPALSAGDTDPESRRSGEQNRPRIRGSRTASGQVRMCKKCGEPLTGQFVRALDGTFHLDCFKCRVSLPPRKSPRTPSPKLAHVVCMLTI